MILQRLIDSYLFQAPAVLLLLDLVTDQDLLLIVLGENVFQGGQAGAVGHVHTQQLTAQAVLLPLGLVLVTD